ncbi:MAG: CapA family protein, partial [bacterium]|nr:CapA family protein [bacterium]
IVAALLSFAVAGRYALHAPTADSYIWPAKPRLATIIFGGDMIFDRSVRRVIDVKGGDFIFSCIDGVLEDADLVVANLEGPITEYASVSASSTPGDEFNYTFTFPPSTAELLYEHNIRMVNLGNNHILNFGWEGARSTTRYLQEAGITYFGLPAGASERADGPAEQGIAEGTVRGIKLAFINYNEFAPAEHSNILQNVGMSSTTIRQIQEARASGYIPVVYTHWGIEYATTSSAYSRELAHSFVDAGAEIVIGSHPHVVEESETYRGKRIYYSLGNFIFDQYFNEDVQHGLLIQVTFGQGGVLSVREIPVELKRDRRTCPVE